METKNRPVFRYQPNIYESSNVIYQKAICQCCHNEVDAYIDAMYCEDDVSCICLDCVASGDAAKVFDGEFIQDVEKRVSDPLKTEELLLRTPGYESWQGEYWLTCCDDYCAYIGSVGTEELEAMGIADEVFTDYESREFYYKDSRKYLVKDGSFCGYLFQCLHCGAYHLWIDAS